MITENKRYKNYGDVSVEQPPQTINEFVMEYTKKNAPDLYRLNTAVTMSVDMLKDFSIGGKRNQCGYEAEIDRVYSDLLEIAQALETDIKQCFYDAVNNYKENEPI